MLKITLPTSIKRVARSLKIKRLQAKVSVLNVGIRLLESKEQRFARAQKADVAEAKRFETYCRIKLSEQKNLKVEI